MGTWKQIAAVGSYHVGRGHDDFELWSEMMFEDYGTVIRPFLEEIYTLSCRMCKRRKLDFSKDNSDDT